MRFIPLLSFFALLLTLPLQAQKDKPEVETLIPRELIFQEKDLINITLSPKGNEVYYQRKSQPKNELFYIRIGRKDENKLSFDGDLINWKPSYYGGIIATVKADSVRLVYRTKTTTKDLTPFPITDAKVLAFSEKMTTKFTVNLKTENPRTNGVWLLDIVTGSPKRRGIMDKWEHWYFDDLLSVVAGVKKNKNGGYDIYRKYRGQWIAAYEHPFDVSAFLGGFQRIISVSNDDNTVYALHNLDRDKTALVAIDTSGQVTELAADAKSDLLPFGSYVNKKGEPEMVFGMFGEPRRHFLNDAVKADFSWLQTRMNGTVSFVQKSLNGNIWLVRELDGGPMKYSIFDRSKKELTPLFSDFPILDDFQMARRKAYGVTTRDNKELPVHVYLPRGSDEDGDGIPDEPLPTILYIHGGPWVGVTHWNSWFHTRNFQLLANRGYAVINAEFRGTSGLGKAMTDAGDLQWGDKIRHDWIDVKRWAAKKGIADEDRTALWGWSFGGYAANAVIGMSPNEFACAISMYGLADLEHMIESKLPDSEQWRTRVGDIKTDEGKALLNKHSPINYVEKVKAPLLMTTGGMDERIPQIQLDDFADALSTADKELVYFVYPEEVHDYRAPESWISFWAIAEQFLATHLDHITFEPAKEDVEKGFIEVIYGEEFISELQK